MSPNTKILKIKKKLRKIFVFSTKYQNNWKMYIPYPECIWELHKYILSVFQIKYSKLLSECSSIWQTKMHKPIETDEKWIKTQSHDILTVLQIFLIFQLFSLTEYSYINYIAVSVKYKSYNNIIYRLAR